MKKTALILAMPALLPLAACADNDAAGEADAAATAADTTTAAMPAEGTTAIVTDGETLTTANGDRVTIDANGVNADITDGDTRVRANVDGNPSITVETE